MEKHNYSKIKQQSKWKSIIKRFIKILITVPAKIIELLNYQ